MAFPKIIARNPFPHSFKEMALSVATKKGEQFYDELLKYLDVNYGLFTNSGRQALYFILKTLLNEGDEIIVPAFSCNVILSAIKKANVKPVFADVDIDSLNMSLKNIEPLITSKTKAVLVTHQFGYPADTYSILEFCRSRSILVIEDAASSFGAELNGKFVGKIGDVGFYSFQESKVISTINGGFIVGNENIVHKIKNNIVAKNNKSSNILFNAFVDGIMSNPYIYFYVLNIYIMLYKKYSMADEIKQDLYLDQFKSLSRFQRNLGFYQLKNIHNIIYTRVQTAKIYTEVLSKFQDMIHITQYDFTDRNHVYSRYAVLVKDKKKFYGKFKNKGIDLGFSFSYMLPQYFNENEEKYPQTEYIINNILNIPIHINIDINMKIAEKMESILMEMRGN